MYELDAQHAIEIILNTKTREAIIDYIDGYGDSVDWGTDTTREILEEVWRSDKEAGEESDGILANMSQEFGL